MRIEWDEAKNRSNLAKHGVSFDTARLVFDDPLHLSVQDRDVGGEAQSKMTEQKKEIEKLARMADNEIDTSDLPEVSSFDDAVRGRFYRPIKQQITLRVDADLLAWFRAQEGKYQSRINQALREYVESHRKAG